MSFNSCHSSLVSSLRHSSHVTHLISRSHVTHLMSLSHVTHHMSLISCLITTSLISCLITTSLISCLIITSLILASRDKERVTKRVYQRVQKMEFTEIIGLGSVNQLSFITCHTSHVSSLRHSAWLQGIRKGLCKGFTKGFRKGKSQKV